MCSKQLYITLLILKYQNRIKEGRTKVIIQKGGENKRYVLYNIIVAENDYLKKVQAKILVCLYFFVKNLLTICYLGIIIYIYLLLY